MIIISAVFTARKKGKNKGEEYQIRLPACYFCNIASNQLTNHLTEGIPLEHKALIHLLLHYKYIGIFSLFMFGLIGLPVPDEVLLTLIGILVTEKKLALIPSALTSYAGSVTGMSFSYWIGRALTKTLVKRFGRWFGITPERLGKAHTWFERYGKWTISASYFIPGLRHVIAYFSGFSRLSYPRFLLFAIIGAGFWITLFLSLGLLLGRDWLFLLAAIHRYMLIAVCLAAMLLLFGWSLKKTMTKPRKNPEHD